MIDYIPEIDEAYLDDYYIQKVENLISHEINNNSPQDSSVLHPMLQSNYPEIPLSKQVSDYFVQNMKVIDKLNDKQPTYSTINDNYYNKKRKLNNDFNMSKSNTELSLDDPVTFSYLKHQELNLTQLIEKHLFRNALLITHELYKSQKNMENYEIENLQQNISTLANYKKKWAAPNIKTIKDSEQRWKDKLISNIYSDEQ
ncbi:uncharacterized protein SCDLUD_000511 [Saccharomycodes ludwigii]|uniref:uncharacterized protein n=1 Tax=Saccharomycodes ludwigii TaxID=36035 RepID=UPI001E88751D|nr:hypothetical protein SCDLUD_000511 [Saccharomycodes ludwigii]KAH3902916.1 hypothetical protein SCDLUD_000511 [Saccharomycodes ludwigii]